MLENKNISVVTDTIVFKVLIIFILGLLLLIPTLFILGIVDDRQEYQQDAIKSVLTPIGGSLRLDGVLIVVPYKVRVVYTNGINASAIGYEQNYTFASPQKYSIEGDVEVNSLDRSIFRVPIFTSDLKVKGHFKQYQRNNRDGIYESTGEALLIVGTKSKKSFTKLPNIKVDGESLEEYEALTSVEVPFFDDMFVYKLPEKYLDKGFDFETDFNVQGGNNIYIRPLKSENKFTLSSKWTDPSFVGGWLPTERNISKDGFTATWDVPHFQAKQDALWTTQSQSSYSYDGDQNFIATSFLILSDNYQKTTRSIKYAILFIFIPFLVLLLCELLSKKKLHIIQYGLIGFANVIFFLLLLSISEHLSFNISYLLGATMVTSIVSSYVGSVMKSVKMGMAMVIIQTFAYLFLFITLQLSTYSLLLGSVGLFGVLTFAMYLTRNIDWASPMFKQD